MAEQGPESRVALLVAESFRRAYGTPTMTDAEFDALVGFLDDQKPAVQDQTNEQEQER